VQSSGSQASVLSQNAAIFASGIDHGAIHAGVKRARGAEAGGDQPGRTLAVPMAPIMLSPAARANEDTSAAPRGGQIDLSSPTGRRDDSPRAEIP